MADVMATDAFMDETPNLPVAIGPPSAGEWAAIEAQANALARSNLVPAALRGKPQDIIVIALTGRELQIPPMMALSRVHVIEGKPTLSAELMIALVLRAGHEIRAESQTNEAATVICQRRGSVHESSFTFTMEDAKAAGLTSKDVWKKYPRAMLWARAVSMACRAVFPDVLMGVSYVPEELGAEVDPYTGEVAAPDEETITEAEATAYLARIGELDDAFKTALRERLVEISMVIAGHRDGKVVPRLPKRRQREFEVELEGVEQWNPQPQGSDDDVAEGEIVGEQGEPGGEAGPDQGDDTGSGGVDEADGPPAADVREPGEREQVAQQQLAAVKSA